MEQKQIFVRRLSAKSGEEAENWRQIRELCCRTGNGGAPIAADRWAFFGRLWIGPYERIIPHWTYTATANDTIVGYLTGCPDTARFTRSRLWQSTLPLLVEVIRGDYRGSPDRRKFLRQLFLIERTSERYFPLTLRRDRGYVAAFTERLRIHRSQIYSDMTLDDFIKNLNTYNSESLK